MSAKKPQQDPSRRRFLKGMAIGGSIASVAGTSSAVAITQSPAPVKTTNATASTRQGYQESAHVRRYYDLARG